MVHVLRHVLARELRHNAAYHARGASVGRHTWLGGEAYAPGWYENARTPVSAYSAWTNSANRFTADLLTWYALPPARVRTEPIELAHLVSGSSSVS
jgi:hypothetical protein